MLTTARMGFKYKTSGKFQLFIGLVFVLLALFALVVSSAVAEGQFARELLRSPQFVAAENAKEAKFYVRPQFNWGKEMWYGYYLAPASSVPLEQVPVPPGIEKWLAPGEVAVSAQIAARYPVGSESPWGKVVSIIDENTLSIPTEPFFYAFTDSSNGSGNWGYPSSNWAGDSIAINGILSAASPDYVKYSFFIFFMLVPGLLLVFISGFNNWRLKAALQTMKMIGVNGSRRLVFTISNLIWIFVLTYLLALLYIIVYSRIALKVPFLNYAINPEDVSRISAYYMLLALAVLVVIFIGLMFSLTYGSPQESRQKQVRPARFSKLIGYASLIPAGVLTYLMLGAFINHRSGTYYISLFVLTVLYALAFPTLILHAAEFFSRMISRGKSGQKQLLGLLISAKYRRYYGRFWGFMFAFSATLMILGFAQIYSSQVGAMSGEKLVLDKALGQSALMIDVQGLEETKIKQVLAQTEKLGKPFAAEIIKENTREIMLPKSTQQFLAQPPDNYRPQVKALRAIWREGTTGWQESKLKDTTQIFVLDIASPQPIYEIGVRYGISVQSLVNDVLGNMYLAEQTALWVVVFSVPTLLIVLYTVFILFCSSLHQSLGIKQIRYGLGVSENIQRSFLAGVVFVPSLLISLCCLGGLYVLQILVARRGYGIFPDNRLLYAAFAVVCVVFVFAFTVRLYKQRDRD